MVYWLTGFLFVRCLARTQRRYSKGNQQLEVLILHVVLDARPAGRHFIKTVRGSFGTGLDMWVTCLTGLMLDALVLLLVWPCGSVILYPRDPSTF